MRFPKSFSRRKGGAGSVPVLGTDAAPTITPPSEVASDNVMTCKIRDINGWPVQRVGVCWSSPDAVTPTALNMDLYFWEDTTTHWYKINDTPLSVKPAQLFFFDTVTISEPTVRSKDMLSAIGASSQAGAMEVMLVVTDPGAQVNGTYNIAMGPDLTTVGT
jgi:hypothetical protein